MNRRAKRPDHDPFENHNVGAAADQLDNDIFSVNAKKPTPVVNMIELDRISPDPTQPRHVLPSSIAHYRQNNLSFSEWFGAWQTAASEEGGRRFDIDAYLDAEEEIQRNENPGPIEASLLQVIELAASVKRDGLTNPITVVRYGHDFTIETGERRFYAYQILYSRTHEERWKLIPAQVSDKLNVWRQASENTARQDLNAIGRARQFAILLMDLLSKEGQYFPHYQEIVGPGVCDRYFYALVADAKENRVPSGKGQMLASAMGLDSYKTLSRYRSLLNLPDEVWQIGDDLNLPEELLYNLSNMNPQEATAYIHKIILGQDSLKKRVKQPMTSEEHTLGTRRYFSQLINVLRQAEKGDENSFQEATQMISETRQWLDNWEQAIKRKQRNK